jgi:hypothetical protein
MKENTIPECFSRQGEVMLYGEAPYGCAACEVFERCHKLSVAASLSVLEENVELMVQNGLFDKRLRPFKDLGGKMRDLETGQRID